MVESAKRMSLLVPFSISPLSCQLDPLQSCEPDNLDDDGDDDEKASEESEKTSYYVLLTLQKRGSHRHTSQQEDLMLLLLSAVSLSMLVCLPRPPPDKAEAT